MKQHASIIVQSGFEILFIDFSNLSGEEFIAAVEQVKKYCLQLPSDKHYPSITDMSNAKTNTRVRDALSKMEKEIKVHHKGKEPDKIKVVVGIKGLQKLVAGAITKGITYLPGKQEAIDFIIKGSLV